MVESPVRRDGRIPWATTYMVFILCDTASADGVVRVVKASSPMIVVAGHP